MKVKILHTLHSLQVGGLENGVVNLINSLDSDRFEHAICCITTSGPMADRIIHPVEVVTLGKGRGGDYLLPLKLARAIKKVGPDIVHTRNWGAIDGVVAARLAGVHRVIHGEHGREATDLTGTNKRRLMIRKILHPLVARFVTVSAELKTWLVRDVSVPEGKVVQIINGVDADRFRPADDKAAAKTKAGLPPSSFVIGSVGRLDPVKDYSTLIRGFAAAIACQTGEIGKAILVSVGSGPEESNLRKLTHDLGITDRVYFMGERKDIPEVLQAMDLFVLPSIAEGISNTILEAMSCGLPVIATMVGGNPELIDEGKSGFLFKPGDDDALAHLLVRYCHDASLQNNHGSSGRSRVEKKFSLSRMVKAYDEIYRTLMS